MIADSGGPVLVPPRRGSLQCTAAHWGTLLLRYIPAELRRVTPEKTPECSPRSRVTLPFTIVRS